MLETMKQEVSTRMALKARELKGNYDERVKDRQVAFAAAMAEEQDKQATKERIRNFKTSHQ